MKQETLEQIVSKQFQKEFNKEVGKVLVQELKKKEMKQTAVEWLVEILELSNISNQYQAEIEQAKEMEKQQIIDACNLQRNDYRGMPTYNKSGEQYYNETYKK